MSTRLFSEGTPTPLTLNLEDGETGVYPRAFIFSNGSIITSVDLGHIGLGRYSGTWIPGALSHYDALFVVYTDTGHSSESDIYTREMERWQNVSIVVDAIDRPGLPGDVAESVWDALLASHTIAGSAGEFLGRLTAARAGNIDDTNVRVRLLEKIMRNRLELDDGSVDNWTLYDDDGVTPLLRWNVTDKSGGEVRQPAFVPSRRTRGEAP